jgi:hypothetical protein
MTQTFDILSEGGISLAAAARDPILRLDGKSPNPRTLWRWCRHGLDGVRLEHVFIGKRVATSRKALGRFATAVARQKAFQPGDAAERSRSPAPARRNELRRVKDVRGAEKRLAAAKI